MDMVFHLFLLLLPAPCAPAAPSPPRFSHAAVIAFAPPFCHGGRSATPAAARAWRHLPCAPRPPAGACSPRLSAAGGSTRCAQQTARSSRAAGAASAAWRALAPCGRRHAYRARASNTYRHRKRAGGEAARGASSYLYPAPAYACAPRAPFLSAPLCSCAPAAGHTCSPRARNGRRTLARPPRPRCP